MTRDGQRRLVVKKAIRDWVEEEDGHFDPGSPKYADLMQNVEGQVQDVLEDMGEIEY